MSEKGKGKSFFNKSRKTKRGVKSLAKKLEGRVKHQLPGDKRVLQQTVTRGKEPENVEEQENGFNKFGVRQSHTNEVVKRAATLPYPSNEEGVSNSRRPAASLWQAFPSFRSVMSPIGNLMRDQRTRPVDDGHGSTYIPHGPLQNMDENEGMEIQEPPSAEEVREILISEVNTSPYSKKGGRRTLLFIAIFVVAVIGIGVGIGFFSTSAQVLPEQSPISFCGSLEKDGKIKATLASFLNDDSTSLTVDGELLDCLPSNAFSDLDSSTRSELNEIKLIRSGLTKISPDAFAELPSLTTLSLSMNGISDLPENLLSSLTQLEDFSIASNGIKDLPRNFFLNNPSLRRLYLENNNGLQKFPEALKGLKELDIINLSDCSSMVWYDDDTFKNIKITTLDLSNSGVSNVNLEDNFREKIGLSSITQLIGYDDFPTPSPTELPQEG